MHRVQAAFLVLAVGLQLQAQTINLSGKVTGVGGKAVHGAIVTLKSNNLIDTTDADGNYTLSGTLTSVKSAISKSGCEAIYLKNNVVAVKLSQPAPVTIRLFNMQGKQLNNFTANHTLAGDYHFSLNDLSLAENMMIVHVSTGRLTASFRYVPNLNSTASHLTSSAGGFKLAKSLQENETLETTALGYKTKSTPITSFAGTVDITLESEFTGQCTQSKNENKNYSGSGPHKVVVETNSASGINEGTIYRPQDLGYGKKYPIYVWGNGACSKDGTGNYQALAEIASHGYFVISDGRPSGSGSRSMDINAMRAPALAYINWIIAENRRPCSPYYNSIDTTKIAGNGFSCGGFLGMGIASDPRTTTWGISSSGSFGDNPSLWNSVHTPVLILEGHKDETGAYNNGLRDYNGIAPKGYPIMFFSNRNMGHGGDLWSANGGDFTRINLAWLNWWMKGDTGATGKGVLVGSGCRYCTDNNWEVKSANLP